MDNGFAFISEVSVYAGENEVLFNAMNTFQIKYVNWETRTVLVTKGNEDSSFEQEMWVVKLEYTPMGKLLEKKKKMVDSGGKIDYK